MNEHKLIELENKIRALECEKKYNNDRIDYWKERFKDADEILTKTIIVGFISGFVIGVCAAYLFGR